jgi:hypothetical protein
MRAIKFDQVSKALLFAAVATVLLTSGSVFAQGVGAMSTHQDDEKPGSASVAVGYGHLFESDTDNNGNVSRDNASIDIRNRSAINENMGFTVVGGYEFAGYDFGGAVSPAGGSNGAGTFQWDDIHSMRLAGLFDWKMNEKWTLVAAAAVFSNSEGGADYRDGITAGMGVGFSYKASENLKLGFLLAATSAIEESATLLPIPQVDWRFAEGWRWRIDLLNAFGTRGLGTELSFRPSDELEFAVGIMRQRKRFRLANHGGVADRGVGEVSSVPVFLRVGYMPAPNIHLHARVGVAMQGSLRTESRTGNRLESDEFDPSPIVGVGAKFIF